MFIYSLSGLQLTDAAGPAVVEIEDNETTARTAVYQTFGRLFLPPDAEYWDLACDGRWAKELVGAGTLLAFAFEPGEQPVPTTAQADLAADYERLLAGTLRAGVWFDDAARTHDEVVRCYEYFGLGTPDDAQPVDHLVTECDFMQYLTFKEASAAADRLRGSYRRAQLDFLERHLSQWLPRFVAEVGADGNAFYTWVTGALARFVEADLAYVRQLLGA